MNLTAVVTPDEAGTRLDKFLAAAGRLGSRSRAATALERGKVFVNDVETAIADAARRLEAGDAVRVWMDRPGSARPVVKSGRIGDVRVVHDDDDMIVVDKPAGLLTVPLERRANADSVAAQLMMYFRARHKPRPLVVHRIDRDTSGLVIFARNHDARERLRTQFMEHEVDRIYWAVVHGHPAPPSGQWLDHVTWDDRALVQKAVAAGDPRGKPAESRYTTLETFRSAALLEVSLVTGRRNQIRLQAALRGHPLVGEERYIEDRDGGTPLAGPLEFDRQALHALRLRFKHPATGETVQFEAPLPHDMKRLMARLRRS